jgi:hypothetical protein
MCITGEFGSLGIRLLTTEVPIHSVNNAQNLAKAGRSGAQESPVDDKPIDAIVSTLLLVRSVQEHPPKKGERRCTRALLHPLLRDLERVGLPFDDYTEGPWWVGCEHLGAPHRHGDRVIPTVTRGHYRLRLEEPQTALQLAGYLSWRQVPEPPEPSSCRMQGGHPSPSASPQQEHEALRQFWFPTSHSSG